MSSTDATKYPVEGLPAHQSALLRRIGATPYLADRRGRQHTLAWLGAMPAVPRERYAERLHRWETDAANRWEGARLEAARTAFTMSLQAEREAELARQQAERYRGKHVAKYKEAREEYRDAADRHQRALELLLRIEELPERRRGSSEADALGRIRAGLADDLL